MEIIPNVPFYFKGERYRAEIQFREEHRYIVMKFSEDLNTWINIFESDTLEEVLRTLENIYEFSLKWRD